jgi:hypothetical protein
MFIVTTPFFVGGRASMPRNAGITPELPLVTVGTMQLGFADGGDTLPALFRI